MKEFLDRAGVAAARGLKTVLGRVALERALRWGELAGKMFFYFSSRRHVAYADLKAALGDRLTEKERRRVIREHYGHLGRMFVETLLLPAFDRAAIERSMTFEHPGRFSKIEGPMILLTGHFGNWELLQAAWGILGKPVHVLARDQRMTRLNQYLNTLRETHGAVSVGRGMGIRDLVKSLRNRELVGMLGDQDAGRDSGVIVPFFGRKTTVPTGAFELAKRTGAPVLSVFMARTGGSRHTIFIGEPILTGQTKNHGKDVETSVRRYIAILEDFIRRYPGQWLWETKRWKYNWTKRILILSDGKAGHEKQSEAVARQFQNLKTQYGRPGIEYPVKKILVKFKSPLRKKLFRAAAFFLLPWAQGRLRLLAPFFEEETFREILGASAEFVISAGSSLAPLNLLIARDSRAKSVVLMNPGFPYHLFHYDLALIPAHDAGLIPGESFRTVLTPSLADPSELSNAQEVLRRELRAPDRVRFAVFLGGPARHFNLERADVELLFSKLSEIAKNRDADYVVTTSRRTPEDVAQFLKEKAAKDPACQLVVIAKEDPRPEAAPGMMALAEILIVTEDSISMISEAVQAGKKVIVLRFGANGLPRKHARFKRMLAEKSAILTAGPWDLEDKIRQFENPAFRPALLRDEKAELEKRLAEIL